MTNKALQTAQNRKKDDFYTEYTDVEFELDHYRSYFKDKVIYCNCDDPTQSSIAQYFHQNFAKFGLKKLICSYLMVDVPAAVYIYTGRKDSNVVFYDEVIPVKRDADFRDEEMNVYLDEADLVVTNPPFSLFRDFIELMARNDKQFIVWGNLSASTYKNVFPLLQQNKLHYGFIRNKACSFRVPQSYKEWDKKLTNKKHDGFKHCIVPAITVYTTLPVSSEIRPTVLDTHFSIEKNLPYDNFAAFEVNNSKKIPLDKTIVSKISKERLQGWQDVYGDDLTVKEDNDSTVTVEITHPIYGIPVSGLVRNYDGQIEIVGIADRHNSSGLKIHQYSKKEYDNYSDLNGRSCILDGGKMHKKYVRIFIRVHKNH